MAWHTLVSDESEFRFGRKLRVVDLGLPYADAGISQEFGRTGEYSNILRVPSTYFDNAETQLLRDAL